MKLYNFVFSSLVYLGCLNMFEIVSAHSQVVADSQTFEQQIYKIVHQDDEKLFFKLLNEQIKNKKQLSILKSQGGGLLWTAVFNGNLKIVQYLLQHVQVDPNILSKISGVTPLLAAVSRGHLEIVELLLKSGADVNFTEQHGFTALMLACQRGYDDIVQVLLKYGAKINLQNQYGYSALMIAIIHGYTEIVQLLLKAKANPKLVSYDQWDAMSLARSRHRLAIIGLLQAVL